MRAERAARRWEGTAWVLLVLVNGVTHFAALGARAMSHDESLHAFYSHVLATTGVYQHDPMMHGPLLFHVNALVYLLLGTSDTTARLFPAVAGLGLVACLFMFRRWLGRWGALAAAVLVSLSPTILFYGRYIRNDVMAGLFTMVWVLGAFRYLETRRRAWLWLMVAAMALDFASKEVSFLFGATIGTYFAVMAAWRRWRHHEPWAASRSGELALVMLTLVLPFVSAVGHLVLGSSPTASASRSSQNITLALGAGLAIFASLLAGLAFRRRGSDDGTRPLHVREWAGLWALFWGVEITLYSTLFTNLRQGLASGLSGNIGYWLEQHDVGRGGQPWFYYLMLAGLYEFLPLLLSAGAALALARKRWPQPGPRARFARFCLYWSAGSFVLYSVAGEKMPWLLLHMTLPMCVLGGAALQALARGLEWPPRPWPRALLLGGGLPMAAILLAPLLRLRPFLGRTVSALVDTNRWLLHVTLTLVLWTALWRAARRVGRGQATRLLALGGAAFLALLTARYAFLLTFVNDDLATELLVYAHATPDIKRAMAEIDEVAARTGVGAELEVACDDDTAWPLTWYLRDYPRQKFYADSPDAAAMSAPVVIVGAKNFDKAAPFLEREYVRRDYRLIWWPIEDYTPVGLGGLPGALRDPERREGLRQYVFYRRYPGVDLARWPYRHEFRLYLRRDLVRDVWPLGWEAAQASLAPAAPPVREVQCEARASYEGPFAGAALREPAGVAVGADGTRAIADTGNHRIVVLDREGRLRVAFGSRCDLARGSESGCVDPDGEGPLGLGDGQFQEPWGVAVGPQGEIAVADTWNGRLQVFDRDGRFLRTWGQLDLENPATVPTDRLYGPRALTADGPRARLLVADTGHKRVLAYGWDGVFQQEVGGAGSAAGRFEEPVGIAVRPDGFALVADTWNRRIQLLGRQLEPVAEWPLAGWEGRATSNKPFLAANAEHVYASEPEKGRVIVLGADGTSLARIKVVSPAPWGRPTGLALDDARRELLVADPARNRVWVLPAFPAATCSDPH